MKSRSRCSLPVRQSKSSVPKSLWLLSTCQVSYLLRLPNGLDQLHLSWGSKTRSSPLRLQRVLFWRSFVEKFANVSCVGRTPRCTSSLRGPDLPSPLRSVSPALLMCTVRAGGAAETESPRPGHGAETHSPATLVNWRDLLPSGGGGWSSSPVKDFFSLCARQWLETVLPCAWSNLINDYS